jgi:hypothetical protein
MRPETPPPGYMSEDGDNNENSNQMGKFQHETGAQTYLWSVCVAKRKLVRSNIVVPKPAWQNYCISQLKGLD